MPDKFENYGTGLESPAPYGEEITPHDTTPLNIATRALYVGGAGDVKVEMVSGAILTFTNMPAGWHPIRVKKVLATGTTATGLVGVS